jgi:hypothetical protein
MKANIKKNKKYLLEHYPVWHYKNY